MQAIIEVKKGEKIYKIIKSPWLKDSDGDVLFKLLSKQKVDGEIETVVVVERGGGIKTPIIRTTTPEERFHEVVDVFRTVVWRDFPDVDLTIEDVEMPDIDKPKSTSQFIAAKNTKAGAAWVKFRKRLGL